MFKISRNNIINAFLTVSYTRFLRDNLQSSSNMNYYVISIHSNFTNLLRLLRLLISLTYKKKSKGPSSYSRDIELGTSKVTDLILLNVTKNVFF